MARTTTKFIKWGTGSDDVNSRSMPANYTPSNYTPAAAGSEGTDKVSSHLKGIDSALAGISSPAGEIGQTTWNGLANNTANQSITGLSFSNASVRAFEAIISLTISATSNLYTLVRVQGIQRGSDWVVTEQVTGDNITGLSFDCTNAGQVRVSIGSISGFSSAKVQFRARVLSV